jgi:hypothetical protein
MKNGAVNKYKRINSRKWEIEHDMYIYILYIILFILYNYIYLYDASKFGAIHQQTGENGVQRRQTVNRRYDGYNFFLGSLR